MKNFSKNFFKVFKSFKSSTFRKENIWILTISRTSGLDVMSGRALQLEMCSTVHKKCGHAKSHASLLVVAMVHLLWLSGSCSCYFSHTFETRDRIRKIECIKVKAESRARRESNQWLLLRLLEPIYSKKS